MLGTLPATAQEGSLDGGAASNFANVSLSDTSLSRAGRELAVTFTLSNSDSVQTNVRYGIVLVKGGGDDATVVDEYVYDEQLTLPEDEPVTRTVSYTAPVGLTGEYTVYVVSKNDEGFPFGLARAGEASLPASEAALALDHASCYLTVTPGNKRVSAGGVVSLTGDETLVSHCSVANIEPGPVTFTPWYETRRDSLFGEVVIAEGGSSASIDLKAEEEKMIVSPLPRATEDGVYTVALGYDAHGNDIAYTYSLGTSASIENVLLDGSGYSSGREAGVDVILRGSGTYTLAILLSNADGDVCGETFTSIEVSGAARVPASVPVKTTCSDPRVSVGLTDSSNELMDTYVGAVNLAPKPEQGEAIAPSHQGRMFDFGPSFFISIIALAVGLGIFYHSLYKKGKINMPKAPLVILAFVLFGLGVGDVQAATFTQNDGACTVSISYDPSSSQIRTGQAINIYGYTSCPGLRVDATLLNAGYGFSVTANSFGGFNGSYPAPPADDVIQYVSGDAWQRSPFTGELMPPYDFVFVNRCLPQTISNCSTPTADYFGVPVGTTGGTCISSGSCSYTCQSDLTWRMNSNSCGAPPPPPPGSTPEFTSTPTCVIGANASSCTATVNVSVPASYAWGADIKTCSGTLLQTVTPGNHTVTVTVPYNTACFSIHPWSFIPVPETDRVTGTSSCDLGTNWNGTVCAPLPPPAVPTGLAAQTWGSCGAKTIKLTWNDVPGATRYDVERDGVLIASVLNPFIDTVTVDGSVYMYRVRAWNANGVSAWSSAIQGTAPAACIGTGSISVLTCAIQAGQSTCSAQVSWTTTNVPSPSMLQNGTSFSTAATGSNVPRSVSYGTTQFVLRDGGTTLDSENVSIGCVSGTSWNGSQCVVPVPPPSTRPCAGTEILGCQLDPTAHGSTDGTCNPATYTGTCSYTCSDGTWGAPSTNNCSIIVTPPPVVTGPPTLTTTSLIVRQGSTVTLNWDTNNGNETLCRLSGGSVNLPALPSGGDVETGSTTTVVNARTTYTLTCPSGTATLTVEVIPSGSET